MKKALTLLVAIVMIVMLAVPALAATDSAQLRLVTDNVLGCKSIRRVMTTAPAAVKVTVTGIEDPEGNAVVQLNLKEAKLAAQQAGAADPEQLDSFEIEVTKDGVPLRSGVTVIVELDVPEEYVGKYLYVMRSEDMGGNGDIEDYETFRQQCIKIDKTSLTLTLTSYGTFTLVVADKPISVKSPKTGDRGIYALLGGAAVLGMLGVFCAVRRKKEI